MDPRTVRAMAAEAGMLWPPPPLLSRPVRQLLERLERRLLRRYSGRAWALLLTPPLVLASMELAFRHLAAALGPKAGYFAAFSLYWSGWCLAVPLWTAGGWEAVRGLFGKSQEPFGRRPLLGAGLLAWPPLLAGGAVFVRQVTRSSPAVILSSLGLALVNATGEELLWRGAYLHAFPESKALGWLYPAVGFGAWHLAPQAVHPNTHPGGAWSLAAVSLAGGLGYGWTAWSTRSIRWTTAFHILWDFLGLGGRIYLA